MPDSRSNAGSRFEPRVEVRKTFDIRARYPLELEIRLDRFTEALGTRGGRVLDISRGLAAGDHCALVRYSLPLPAVHGRPKQREGRAGERT